MIATDFSRARRFAECDTQISRLTVAKLPIPPDKATAPVSRATVADDNDLGQPERQTGSTPGQDRAWRRSARAPLSIPRYAWGDRRRQAFASRPLVSNPDLICRASASDVARTRAHAFPSVSRCGCPRGDVSAVASHFASLAGALLRAAASCPADPHAYAWGDWRRQALTPRPLGSNRWN
jgi:hypothetical protein